MSIDPIEARERLGRARLMLLFSPELCAGRDPMRVLEQALPHVDVLQLRIKPSARALSSARELYEWTLRVLAGAVPRCLVLVNDRVDVAGVLAQRGCAGVHLGQDDMPAAEARRVLGEHALIGLSTHDLAQVAEAGDAPIDYLGFGPIHATATKGYEAGLGAELAWAAHAGASLPLFPIGGIDAQNVAELAPIGRAAVSRAILAAADPAQVALAIRSALDDSE